MQNLPVALFIIFSLAACSMENSQMGTLASVDNKTSDSAHISGTVSYRERILLRPGSRLEVSLKDVSRADAPARVIANLEMTDPGQVPITFELSYNPDEIDERMTYSLRARIIDSEGNLLFINDTHVPVLTRGAGSEADMMLRAVDRKPDTRPAGMELEGLFRYMADAALFQDCSTGKTWPVEMSGQYIELERAYLNSGIEPGKELKVSLIGRYLEKPGMENNNVIKLIVDKFNSISENQECQPQHHAELLNTYWKLLELNGQAVVVHSSEREPHLVLQGEEKRVSGHGGCNRFFGSFELGEETLEFATMGSTMMACVDGMETEQAFLQALEHVSRYRISGQFLELYEDATLLARFEAVYF